MPGGGMGGMDYEGDLELRELGAGGRGLCDAKQQGLRAQRDRPDF